MSRDAAIDLADAEAATVRWVSMVWRLVQCRLRSRADAEDAFQNTFLALCRNQPAFESLEHQKAWLLRCAINCCNQINRARAGRLACRRWASGGEPVRRQGLCVHHRKRVRRCQRRH